MNRIQFIHDDTELTHHGIKGMKWGVRKQRMYSAKGRKLSRDKSITRKEWKKIRDNPNANYTEKQRKFDSKGGILGKAVSKSVNRNMNLGMDHKTALAKTIRDGSVKTAAGIKLATAAPKIIKTGKEAFKIAKQAGMFWGAAKGAVHAKWEDNANTMGLGSAFVIHLQEKDWS